MQLRRIIFSFLLAGFLTISVMAPALAMACSHSKKIEQQVQAKSDCPMHKKAEPKKEQPSNKTCCGSAACKVPQASSTGTGQHYSQAHYQNASLVAFNDNHVVYSAANIITPPPR